MKNLVRFIVIVVVLFVNGYSTIFIRDTCFYYNAYEAETAYVGANVFVKDSCSDIIVTYKKLYLFNTINELFFIIPGKDSSRFLFHNIIRDYPNDDSVVNLGKFPKGTKLTFMSVTTDTNERWSAFYMKKRYSGQNRVGIDEYISEINGIETYGNLFAAVGRVDSNTVEYGFTEIASVGMDGAFFNLNNVYLEGVEKNKIARINFLTTNPYFEDTLSVKLNVPKEARRTIIVKRLFKIGRVDTISDTIDPVKKGANLRIYYTLDGSIPTELSNLYNENTGIKLTATTTIKALARMEGDTNWFDSDIAQFTYIKGKTVVVKTNFRINNQTKTFLPYSDKEIFALNGRKLNTVDLISNCCKKNISTRNRVQIVNGRLLIKNDN